MTPAVCISCDGAFWLRGRMIRTSGAEEPDQAPVPVICPPCAEVLGDRRWLAHWQGWRE